LDFPALHAIFRKLLKNNFLSPKSSHGGVKNEQALVMIVAGIPASNLLKCVANAPRQWLKLWFQKVGGL
jgi:hypothetical protein